MRLRLSIGSLTKVVAAAPAIWLRPLHPALHPPGAGLVRTLEGHSGPIYGVAVTPDGKRAVSASGDKTLKVWDLETGVELRTLEGHSDSVHGVAVTADGKRAVSASRDHTLKVWDLETGLPLPTFHCDAYPTCCAFADAPQSADEQMVIAGDALGRLHFLLIEERN